MSGGSHNYLYCKDSDEILNHISDIEGMRDRLTEEGYLDAAKETEEVILVINSFNVRMQARLNRLSQVWRAVEWCDSGDSDPNHIKEEVEKYREL
jgi:hypothetical protein